MSIAFDQSVTHLNLMRAFAGESQARNRYTFAAEQADAQGLRVIGDTFRFTAGQEKEHAEIFLKLLSELNRQNITVDGAYPVNLDLNALDQLRAARHNENEEGESVYPAFAAKAREEGFSLIGDIFAQIAAIERTHAQRFGRFANALSANALFSAPQPVAWLCLNCGHIHFGASAPAVCPVCQHEQGFFIRESLVPFLSDAAREL